MTNPYVEKFVAGLLASVFLMSLPPGARATDPQTQISREGGVTVTVTPKDGLASAADLAFNVVLETHSASLDQDMVKAAVLIDGSGGVHPALSWEGDPAGGHHRKGVLRFGAAAAGSGSIELRIAGVGGVPERVFRWQLAE